MKVKREFHFHFMKGELELDKKDNEVVLPVTHKQDNIKNKNYVVFDTTSMILFKKGDDNIFRPSELRQ